VFGGGLALFAMCLIEWRVGIILRAIQLLLYLISDNAEIEDAPPQVRVVRDSSSPKIRRLIQDKAGEVKAKNVGVRIGSTIRRTMSHGGSGENTGTGSGKRPHMRRGHWHNYWTGPMDGERRLVLKWTAPTMIHADKGADDNVVVYPVKIESRAAEARNMTEET